MNHYMIAGFLTFITNTVLAAIVIGKNSHAKVNRYFFLFSVSAALYGLGFFLQAVASTIQQSYLAIHINLTGTICVPVFFLLTVCALLDQKLSKKSLFLLYSTSSVFLFLNWATELLIKEPVPKFQFKYLFQAGIFYPLLAVFFSIVAINALYRLYKGYHEKTGFRQIQLKYFFIGTLIEFAGGTPGFALGYNYELFPFNPFGAYCVPIYCIITAYVLTKYRLMGFKGAMKMFFAPILAIIATMVCSMVFHKIWMSMNARFFSMDEIVLFSMFNVGFFALCYRGFILLFYNSSSRDNYEDLLYEYSRKLGECNTRHEVISKTMDLLQDKDSPQPKGTIFLTKAIQGDHLRVEDQFGIGLEKDFRLDNNSFLIDFIREEYIVQEPGEVPPILIKDELYKIYGAHKGLQHVMNEIEKLSVPICIPLLHQEKEGSKMLIGIIGVGEPQMTDIYSLEEYDFFKEVALETTKALVNVDVRERIVKSERLAYLGKMAMGWVHQINNILNRISLLSHMNAQMLSSQVETLIGEDKEANELNTIMIENEKTIEDNAVKGGYIAEGLLKLTKTVRGSEFVKVSLYSVIEDSISAVRDQNKLGAVKIYNKVNPSYPPIDGIEHCLEEAFKNLINNAARAVMYCREDGDGWIFLDAKLAQNKQYIEIILEDNGHGMSKEDLKNLGTPLFMPSDGSAPSGHGIGVSVAYYYLMNVHNAKIHVESKKGKGTIFYIALPLHHLRVKNQETTLQNETVL